VPHLHQIVHLNPASYARFAHAGAVDARIRLHLDIVLNHHRRWLWDLVPPSLRRLRKPESIRSNHHAILQQHPVADAAVLAHYRMRVRKKVVANLRPAINHHMRQQHRVRPNLHVLANHHIRPDVSIRANLRRRVNLSRGMHPRHILHRLMKKFERPRKRQVGILRPQHSRSNSREVLAHNYGRSPRSPRRRGVLGVGHKRKLPRPSLFNPVNPSNFGVRRSVFQTRAKSSSNRRKFHE